jgi:hypothetical protein
MNFEQAKESAVESAMFSLRGLYTGPPSAILEKGFRETNDCWMFFRSRSIKIPPERALSDFAYAYSKHSGEGRCVPDYWDDQPRLEEYLVTLSNYFASSNNSNR